jgi:glutathione-regulated potassium-efflux system ancillary protein KefG
MNEILILFAHPRYEKSRANRTLLKDIGRVEGVTLHDLYEEYANFNVDAERERTLLLDHQVIIWQHPFYNYGPPALMKQWVDMVLEYGWAHGKGGNYLKDKTILNVLTTGGTREFYASGGHGATLREFLAPLEQTARLCGMIYLPPFVMHGTYLLGDKEMGAYRQSYHSLLARLKSGKCNPEIVGQYEYINDWLDTTAISEPNE